LERFFIDVGTILFNIKTIAIEKQKTV